MMMKRMLAVGAMMAGLALAGTAQAAPVSTAVGVQPAATGLTTPIRFAGGGHAMRGGHAFRGGRAFRGGHAFRGGRAFRGGHAFRGRYGHRHRYWRNGRWWWGPAIGLGLYGGYYYGGDYYGGCGWLHRRAINTGSRYWWRRYYNCRGW